ncbi:S8 family peptidase [Cerasicoccus maritimus]|uniref:S8 family peptidase n=1 Tax=Cerasicoccus maritimus TaxID=490089 RepID=UPI002852D439|nr:S8 family serine peptidase [Cerasicoccus maritimus]
MSRAIKILALGALVLITVVGVFWLGRQRDEAASTPSTTDTLPTTTSAPQYATAPNGEFSARQPQIPSQQPHSESSSARTGEIIEGEAIVQFDDKAAFNEAIRILTNAGIPMTGSISSLGMLRVELPAGGIDELRRLLGDRIAETYNNIAVALPEPIDAGADGAHLQAFGDNWIKLLGAPDDIADWGKGVRIAVIDAGVTSHPALSSARIDRYALIEELVANGHGNAVTSLIVGNGDLGQPSGLAPAADILAYQALGEDSGNTFTIAQGIVDAVDHGANIINLSLGGWGDTPAVRQAVQYAHEKGVVIVAAVGNDRLDQITYPAAYPEVIAVTSVDAGLHWAEYPNAGLEGKWPDIAAPGVGLPAAYTDRDNILFSGTSAATPVVSAAIAATMSELNVSAQEAASIVLAQTSDRGEPGADPFLGTGVLDLTRVMRANEKGVVDLAVTDHYVDAGLASSAGLPVRIGIQNRGTTVINHPVLTLMIGAQNNRSTIQFGPIAPGQVIEYEATIPAEFFTAGRPAAIGTVINTEEAEDVNTANNVIVTAYGVTLDDDGQETFIEARVQ